MSEKDWYGKRTEAELLAELDQDFDREVYGAHLFDMPSPEEAKKAIKDGTLRELEDRKTVRENARQHALAQHAPRQRQHEIMAALLRAGRSRRWIVENWNAVCRSPANWPALSHLLPYEGPGPRSAGGSFDAVCRKMKAGEL